MADVAPEREGKKGEDLAVLAFGRRGPLECQPSPLLLKSNTGGSCQAVVVISVKNRTIRRRARHRSTEVGRRHHRRHRHRKEAVPQGVGTQEVVRWVVGMREAMEGHQVVLGEVVCWVDHLVR